MLTPHQNNILAFLRENGGTATKKQVVARFGHWYYCNAEKHIGDILGRMVRARLLKRARPGVYETGTGTGTKTALTDKNQTTLF